MLLAEFRNFSAPTRHPHQLRPLDQRRRRCALLITGTNFNVASFMGLIMVIGIVAKNGILLLDADEKAPRRRPQPSRGHACTPRSDASGPSS